MTLGSDSYEDKKVEIEKRIEVIKNDTVTDGIVNNIASNKLKRLELEVHEMNLRIKNEAEENKIIMSLFKGFQIYISPILFNPKVLFLGINPGSGYYDKHQIIVQQFEPLAEQDSGYGPWAQLEYCFNRIGKADYLNTIVKTNAYFISTKNEAELNKLLKYLPAEIRNDFIIKSKEWVKTIISEIMPINIICGGTLSLKILKAIFPEYIRMEGNGNVSMGKIGNITVFMYKRSHSNIRKKNDLIKYLSMYLN